MVRRLAGAYREAFAGLPRAAWLISGAMLVNRMGTMVVPFLTLYLTRELGFSLGEVGWLLGAAGIGGIAGSYLGGKICDLVDARMVQIISLASSGAVLILLGWARDKTTIVVGFLLFYLLGDMFRPASAVAIQTAVPAERRRQAAGLRRLAINLGVSIAPVVGGLLAVHDYLWLFVLDGATSLAAAFFLWRWTPPTRGAFVPAESLALAPGVVGSPWRDGFFLRAMALVAGSAMLFMQTMSTVPLVLNQDYGLREDAIGLLLAINPALIVLVEMVLLRAIADWPALPVLAAGSVLVGAGLGLFAFGNTFWWATLPIVCYTVGEMLAFPTTEAWVAARAPDSARGAYLGVYSMSFGLATGLAPVVGMKVLQYGGAQLLWLSSAIAGLVIGLFFLLLGRLERGEGGVAAR
jgi:predicted MFS family arabinose efflux permease